MPDRPLVIAFDVMETLFPLEPLGERLRQAGQPPALLRLWFTRALRDTFALTAAGGYQPFPEVAVHALRAVTGPGLSEPAARDVVAGLAGLDPHPDAAEAMRLALDAGVRLIALTNGSAATTAALLRRSGLDSQVERVVTAHEVRRAKPAPEPYRHAAATCGVPPERVALVAEHGWDTHGARRAGLRAGWVSRLEGRWNELFTPPDVTGPDLPAVVRGLLAPG